MKCDKCGAQAASDPTIQNGAPFCKKCLCWVGFHAKEWKNMTQEEKDAWNRNIEAQEEVKQEWERQRLRMIAEQEENRERVRLGKAKKR
jgi:hypothetical protein